MGKLLSPRNQNIIACQKQSALVTVLIWMNLIANFPLYASSGAFERFRKVTVSFLMSVCLSVQPSDRMGQLGSQWTNFREIR